MDWTVKLDLVVRERDVPPTHEEVLRAVFSHLNGLSGTPRKPSEDIELRRGYGESEQNLTVTVEIVAVQVNQGVEFAE